jgi:hypothetical protein
VCLFVSVLVCDDETAPAQGFRKSFFFVYKQAVNESVCAPREGFDVKTTHAYAI